MEQKAAAENVVREGDFGPGEEWKPERRSLGYKLRAFGRDIRGIFRRVYCAVVPFRLRRGLARAAFRLNVWKRLALLEAVLSRWTVCQQCGGVFVLRGDNLQRYTAPPPSGKGAPVTLYVCKACKPLFEMRLPVRPRKG